MSEFKWLISHWSDTVRRVKAALLPHMGPIQECLADSSAAASEFEGAVRRWVEAGSAELQARARAALRERTDDNGFGIALSLLGDLPALTTRVMAQQRTYVDETDSAHPELVLNRILKDFLRDQADTFHPIASASQAKTWRRITKYSEEVQASLGHVRRWSVEHIEAVFERLSTLDETEHNIHFANLGTLVSWFARYLPANELGDGGADSLPLEAIPEASGIAQRLGQRSRWPEEEALLREERALMQLCLEAMPMHAREVIAVKLRLDLGSYVPDLKWPITAQRYQALRDLSRSAFDRLTAKAMAFLKLCFEDRARRKETAQWEES